MNRDLENNMRRFDTLTYENILDTSSAFVETEVVLPKFESRERFYETPFRPKRFPRNFDLNVRIK
jgi:hypothetical protein